jgi:hypothetical protein
MFAHGDHELRTAARNLEDGLVSEDAIRLFKQKQKLLASEAMPSALDTLRRRHPSAGKLEHPFSNSVSVTCVGSPPPVLDLQAFSDNQCSFPPPTRQLTQPHFVLSVDEGGNHADEEHEDNWKRASHTASPSSDRLSLHDSSVVSVATEGTQTLPLREYWPLDPEGQASSLLSREEDRKGLRRNMERPSTLGSSGSSIDSAVVFKYRHDPYGWRAI